MKKLLLFIVLVAIHGVCAAQIDTTGKFYNAMFKWRISIPPNFSNINAADFAKIQEKGQTAIESVVDGKIENQAKQLFVIRSDQFHYMEANYQPFNFKTDGSHLQSFKTVADILYKTFISKMSGVKIDTVYSNEIIDKLSFRCLKLIINISEKNKLHMYMFSKLFDPNKEFSLVLMFMDKDKGALMLDAWRKSTFGK
jgi:hypothetical protein